MKASTYRWVSTGMSKDGGGLAGTGFYVLKTDYLVLESENEVLKRLNAELTDENRRLRNYINNTPIAG